MRPIAIALAAAATLTACQPEQAPRQNPALARPAVRLAAEAAGVQGAPTAVQLSSVDRLQVDLPWSGPSALRAPRVDVTTPKGRLYAQLPVQLQLAPSGGTATAFLEVRGTPIDGYHMVGTWRFALVDDGGPPLTTVLIDLQ